MLMLLLALALPGDGRAQLIGGQAVERHSGLPVSGLHVRLVRVSARSGSAPIDSTTTDRRGLFEIPAPGAGAYQLEFVPGAGSVTRGPVDTVAADASVLRRYAVTLGMSVGDDALREFQVEKPVTPLPAQQPPRYPEDLRQKAVEGEVLAQFVVDTTGMMMPGSFGVLRSTHPAFTAAVKQAVLRMRFHPAEVGGTRVRQVVEMPFIFGINHPRPLEGDWPAPVYEQPTRRRLPVVPGR